MSTNEPFQFSGGRFAVRYHLTGSDREARRRAETLCLDQTVELPDTLVPSGFIREEVLGRVEAFHEVGPGRYEAAVSFAEELLGPDLTTLLNLMYGISSLRPGIRVVGLELPDDILRRWPGPRFGRAGLRALLEVPGRPLVCGVLKPLGLSVHDLANLAYAYALGGLDLIKDDQGLFDQPFSPFGERVGRCAEAVARASAETGKRCLYVAHVSGPSRVMHERCRQAKRAGAGGVMICPGLTGYDAVLEIASGEMELPLLAHPDLLGTYALQEESGIAPSVLFGQLPRLAGADVSIYPTYDGSFSMTRQGCREIADTAQRPWGHLRPMFPTGAGRVSLDRVDEVCSFYEGEVVIIAGGVFLGSRGDVVATCRAFMERVAGWGSEER